MLAYMQGQRIRLHSAMHARYAFGGLPQWSLAALQEPKNSSLPTPIYLQSRQYLDMYLEALPSAARYRASRLAGPPGVSCIIRRNDMNGSQHSENIYFDFLFVYYTIRATIIQHVQTKSQVSPRLPELFLTLCIRRE